MAEVLLRPRLLTVKDVARLCQINRHAARQLVERAGRIPLGRSVRCRPEDLDRVLEELREGGPPV